MIQLSDMKDVIIFVESPTKARTLSRYLGSRYHIEASMGHIRDLPKGSLGVDITHDFNPKYVILKDKKKTVAHIKKTIAKLYPKQIFLATDPDREGEAIAYHLKHIIFSSRKKPKKMKCSRIVFHQITKSAILHALKNPRDIDQNLVDAQQGRRVLDRLVGYKLSPLLWKKLGRRWLSAGRVQSVAVRLIVEREREIESFIPKEYWEIAADVKKKSLDTSDFRVLLVKIDGKKVSIKNKKEADKVLFDLKKAKYSVSHISRKSITKRPYPPFITSTLQRSAATVFGWPARKTMIIAQNLYEKGKITYHRTDSVHLSPEALSMAREYILKIWGKRYLPDKPVQYKTTSKVAQEAHEAIRPTSLASFVPPKEKNVKKAINKKSKLGKDHEKLLYLITKRFLASQMNPQLIDRTTVEVIADNKYLFRQTGEREVFSGWRVLFPLRKESVVLPNLKENEILSLIDLYPQQKFTQPPSRYNEASLIKTLEQKGIGRPSTYAPIISTIQARQYIEKNENRAFYPTNLGKTVNDFLVSHFNDVVSVDFTARMEDNLDAIANGKIHWVQVVRDFWIPFEKDLIKTEKNTKKIKLTEKKTGEKCPECGAELVEKIGRYGKFLACSAFPKCRFTKPLIVVLDIPCPECKKGNVVIKKTRKGKKFFGCSTYPKCTFASWKKPEKGN